MSNFWKALIVAVLVTAAPHALAAGLMKPKDSGLPDLQIRDHRVNVVINNGFAVTEVDQMFHNPNDIDLEAIYTFPLPRAAALSELSLWIDGQEVVGEVVEKERAREIVREEKQAGRETALAEKREYIAFDVFVSPVRAGADVRVRLVYLQPVEIDAGVGRYVYPLEEGRIDEEMHAFWDRQEAVQGRFTFDCTLRSSYPLEDVRTTSPQEATIVQQDESTWSLSIEGPEGASSLDRDVVVYYKLVENLPARVDLLPYRSGEGPGSFMLVITPGADLGPTSDGVDWTIVLDQSGSMAGKIAVAADAVARALDQLRAADRFRVITFSNGATTLVGWQPASEGAIERARERLHAVRTKGGTNMYAGVQAALRGLDSDRPSAIVLVSDGGANVGPTGHRDFLKLLETTDVRVFTFVMGQGANRPLLDRLAEESGGFSMDVSNQDDLYGRILQAKVKLAREAMHGVKVELDGPSVAELAPERLPSAYYGQQIVVFGRYLAPGTATLRVRARISGEQRSWKTRIVLPERDETFPEIERLWALARVRDLQERIDDGEDRDELRAAIVDVGTGYSIVTDYTSMVVVREERFAELGLDRRNLDRVTRERQARTVRIGETARSTRADSAEPMYPGRSSGGLGAGAVGPVFAGLLAALGGARLLSRRRRAGRGGE